MVVAWRRWEDTGRECRIRPPMSEPDISRVLGIDLGGARMPTTGWVLLEGADRPKVTRGERLARTKPERAERRLLELIEEAAPDVVAIDAPLTLPPCLTCPSFCRGPALDLCELTAARQVWEEGGHPVTERLCEVRLRKELRTGPLPTMRIAQIAARGVALARRIMAGGTRLGPAGSVRVLEVYPAASLARLAMVDDRLRPRDATEGVDAFIARVLDALSERIDGVGEAREELRNGHVLDALIAAYTGWLGDKGLERPPEDFNQAAGWIWLPAVPVSARRL